MVRSLQSTFVQRRRVLVLPSFSDTLTRPRAGRVPGFVAASRVQYVRQEARGDERTAVEYVLDAAARADALESGAASDGGGAVIEDGRVLATREIRRKTVRKLLRGFGLTKRELAQPTSELSGGFLMRVALAAALTVQPEVRPRLVETRVVEKQRSLLTLTCT